MRDFCLKHGIDLDRIDARMGWKEAERLRDMQTYYEEQHLRRHIRTMMLTSEICDTTGDAYIVRGLVAVGVLCD